jgi:hypothetical protein
MIIELAILAAAAAAGAGGFFAARRARRSKQAAAVKPAPADPLQSLPAKLGDVLQVGDETRWSRAALCIRQAGRLRGAVLVSREHGREQGTLVLAPPDRHLYWLERTEVDLPATAPSRVEIERSLLDRDLSFPAEVQTLGDDPPLVGESAVVTLYRGALADAALVLAGARATFVWYGRRIDPDDWDNLGQVDPRDES